MKIRLILLAAVLFLLTQTSAMAQILQFNASTASTVDVAFQVASNPAEGIFLDEIRVHLNQAGGATTPNVTFSIDHVFGPALDSVLGSPVDLTTATEATWASPTGRTFVPAGSAVKVNYANAGSALVGISITYSVWKKHRRE